MNLGVDKKSLIIISVIAVIMLVCIFYVFSMSTTDGKIVKVDSELIVNVEGKEYRYEDFQNFKYIKSEAEGDIEKTISGEELDSLINTFVSEKLYLAAAEKNKISVPEEEITNYKTEYTDKSTALASHNIAEEDYLKYKSEEYMINEIKQNFSTYYELPNDIYEEFKANVSGEDLKSYAFRIMTFPYEVKEESGDLENSGELIETNEDTNSGEDSGNIENQEATENNNTDNSGEEPEEDKSRDTVYAKAEDVLNRAKSGEDFETLAKEFAGMRITFKGNGYNFVYGDIEYAAGPLLESKAGNKELYEAMKNTPSGEFTDIIDNAENTTLYFAKMESIEDGFVGESEKELKEILLSQYMDTLVSQNVKYEINNKGVNKIYLTNGK